MKLSDRESLVLGLIEHRARVPLSKIAKEARLREHTVRYIVEKLRERRVIVGQRSLVNVYPLGYSNFTFYLSLAAAKPELRRRFVEELERTEFVSWIGQLGGEFEYGVALTGKRIEEVSQIFNRLSTTFGNVIREKSLSVRLRFSAFGRKYLYNPKRRPQPISYGLSPESPTSIDQTDHNILSALTGQDWPSYRELALELGLPGSTIDRRIKSLQSRGVLTGDLFYYDLSALGPQLYRILIFARGINPDLSSELYKFCAAHPRILHFIECIGEWDYEVGVEVERAEDVATLAQQISDRFGDRISGTKLIQIFRHVKYSSYPFKRVA